MASVEGLQSGALALTFMYKPQVNRIIAPEATNLERALSIAEREARDRRSRVEKIAPSTRVSRNRRIAAVAQRSLETDGFVY